MKVGLNMPSHLLDDGQTLPFARQLGVTHVIVNNHPVDAFPGNSGPYFQLEPLIALRERVEAAGMTLHALENFPAEHWYDVLLAGPRRDEQIENVCESIRNLGRAGVPCMGYYFSIAGVHGRHWGPYARGGAVSVAWKPDRDFDPGPIPHGEVWTIPLSWRDQAPPGDIGTVPVEEVWARLAYFLERVVPVAEQAGVRLAAHPDDPPFEQLRGTGRLITHPDRYERLLSLVPSPSNGLEFCQGTISEMRDSSVYDAVRRYAGRNVIGYVHLRNVVGRVPDYHETFLDDGDVDILKTLRLYRDAGYEGVVVPDHTPELSCAAPWHAGMAWAIGWIRAALRSLDALDDTPVGGGMRSLTPGATPAAVE
jgi:mannonate dehydratase